LLQIFLNSTNEFSLVGGQYEPHVKEGIEMQAYQQLLYGAMDYYTHGQERAGLLSEAELKLKEGEIFNLLKEDYTIDRRNT
jgi:hypothetical protein